MNRLRLSITAVLLLGAAACAGPDRRGTLQMPYEDRIRLASIYIQSGQEEKAFIVLKDALLQEEGRPEAWAMLGELSWLEGDLDSSARHLEKALEAGGEDPVTLNNLAWVESERGRPVRALALADRALALDPAPRYPYLETRARILLELQRYEEAGFDARTALELTPEHDEEMRGKLERLIGTIGEHRKMENGGLY